MKNLITKTCGKMLLCAAFGLSLLIAHQSKAQNNTSYNIDNNPLNPASIDNTAFGWNVLTLNLGRNNTGVGKNALSTNNFGNDNSAVGWNALLTNSFGMSNTACGASALTQNTTGSYNAAFGAGSLSSNSFGNYNTAHGYQSLFTAYADGNTAMGYRSLYANTTGGYNVANGTMALVSNTTGYENTAAGSFALYTNLTGYQNTAIGYQALNYNVDGYQNVAVGYQSMFNNTNGPYPGHENAAVGYQSLYYNTYGVKNVCNGAYSLYSNSNGSWNVANGYYAMYGNTTGHSNTANGAYSLFNSSTSFMNTANGYEALYLNTANQNTATGANSLYTNSTGNGNTANGVQSLYYNTSGEGNTADGLASLYSNDKGKYNTAVGFSALYNNVGNGGGVNGSNGSYNTALGAYANVQSTMPNLTNAMALGYGAIINLSNKTRIGNAAMGQTECQSGIYVVSDGRFKNNISEDDVKGLDFIRKLRPVVYNFDTRKFTEFLTKGMPDSLRNIYLNNDFAPSTAKRQTGFIAQEVEKAAKEVGYNFDAIHTAENEFDNYSIAYSQFVVPLVKAVQEMDKQKAEQDQKIEMLQQQIEQQNKLINELMETSRNITGEELPGATLGQNVPNPFTHETTISYTLPGNINKASLVIYDMTGKQLSSMALMQRGAGSVTFTSDNLAPGIYIYAVIADNKMLDSKRMVVAQKQ